jgi:hypothetical protein
MPARTMQHFQLPILILICLGSLSSAGTAASIRLGHMEADRILFFGNSITYHPPKPEIDWTGAWGMAASDASHDYVHLLTGDIAAAAGATPETMATYNLDWEQNYSAYNYGVSSFQSQLALRPNIVVVAVGENVVSLATSQSQDSYAAAFRTLLTQFKNDGNPTIFVRSEFWADPTKDGIMKQVTESMGGIYVDLDNPGANPLYAASSELGNPWHATGFSSHPGDAGMQAVAESLFGSMVAHSAPEPGSLTLALTASSLLAVFAWRRRGFIGYRAIWRMR